MRTDCVHFKITRSWNRKLTPNFHLSPEIIRGCRRADSTRRIGPDRRSRDPSAAGKKGKWRGAESNRRRRDFQSLALPTELPRHARRKPRKASLVYLSDPSKSIRPGSVSVRMNGSHQGQNIGPPAAAAGRCRDAASISHAGSQRRLSILFIRSCGQGPPWRPAKLHWARRYDILAVEEPAGWMKKPSKPF